MGLERQVAQNESGDKKDFPGVRTFAFTALLGADHILTIRGGPHSPQRMMIESTLVVLLRALG